MKLFRRLSDSLFSPNSINNYIDDRKWYTTIYFFVLIIIMLLPASLSIILSPLVSYEDKVALRESFYHDEAKIPFYINSHILFNSDRNNEFVYKKELNNNTLLVIKANDDNINYRSYSTVIELNRTGVFLEQFGFKTLLFSYKDYEVLNNIRFEKAYDNDSEFWDCIFQVLDKEIPKYEIIYKVANVLLLFVSLSASLALWSLIFTIFNKSSDNRGLKFTKYWQMMVYVLTPYAFCYSLSRLFGLSLIYYIGLLWTIINVLRFSQRIVVIKGDNDDEQ